MTKPTRVSPAAPGTRDPEGATLTVADFNHLIYVYKRRIRGSADVVLGLCFLAILTLGASLSSYGESHGWSSISLDMILVGTLAISVVPHLIAWRRRRALIRNLGLLCPHCSAPLVDGLRNHGRVQYVTTTGACPECSQAVVQVSPHL